MTMSKKARKAFSQHKYNAKRRGIEFLFTREEWWAWWQEDGRWSKRGNSSMDHLVMARFGDMGPYHPDNVYCTPHRVNLSNIPFYVKSSASKIVHARLQGREDGYKNHHFVTHPEARNNGASMARPCTTPEGRFPSAAAAARHFGLPSRTALSRCIRKSLGWAWEDELGN